MVRGKSGFHPIPPGYGLPWGTHEEQEIPHSLVFEAQFALAKEQMKTQTPPSECRRWPGQGRRQAKEGDSDQHEQPVCERTVCPASEARQDEGTAALRLPALDEKVALQNHRPVGRIRVVLFRRRRSRIHLKYVRAMPRCYGIRELISEMTPNLPRLWRTTVRATTRAFDGWQGYLQRSDEFIRFCCHLHIWEMLTARGGAGETRVVWHWPTIR